MATIIYYNDIPYGYELIKQDNHIQLIPAFNEVPEINVRFENNNWIIYGVDSKEVEDQVVKLISINYLIDLPGRLSAAAS